MDTTSAVGALVLTAIAAGALYFLVFCGKAPSILKSLVKTLSIAALAGASYMASGHVSLTLALSFSALGDLLLSRDGDAPFLGGILAFGAAHVAYIVLMAPHGITVNADAPTVILLTAAGIMAALLFVNAGRMRSPVLAYVMVITAMGLAALSLPPRMWIVLIPAGLFIFSDVVIGLERFVLHRNSPILAVTPYLIWSSYFAAQLMFLFAYSLLWIT